LLWSAATRRRTLVFWPNIEVPRQSIPACPKPLRPATVDAPYIIRATIALYMVAASIPGRSIIKNADTIRRAHPRFVENLQTLGADVEWR